MIQVTPLGAEQRACVEMLLCQKKEIRAAEVVDEDQCH